MTLALHQSKSVDLKQLRFDAASFLVGRMYVMPKKIDPKVKERCAQQMLDHVAECTNPTTAAQVVAKRNGVGAESVRRWYVRAQVDNGQRCGASSEERGEIKNLLV